MALSVRTGSRTPKGSDASFRQGVQANPGDNQIPADGYIDVPDEEPLDTPLDITSTEANPSPVYSENTIRSKAAKAQFASGGTISFADAYSKINSGMEAEIQQSIYKQSQIDAEKRRVGVMKEVVDQAGQQGVTPETLSAVRSLSVPQLDDPAEAKIALEKAFSKQYVNQHVANNPNTTKMVQEAGDKGLDMLDVTQEAIARGQIASTQLERVKGIADNQSWVGWGVDLAKSVVPGYSWYKKHDIVSSAPTSSILPGGNTKDQINYLFGLPPSQMNEKLGEALDQLAKDNPQLAVEFARAVQNYSASEALFDNLIGVVDAASVADVAIVAGRVVGRAVGAAGKAAEAGAEAASKGTLRQALKDAVGAANKPAMKVEDAVAAAGDVDQSAILNAVKQSRLKGTSKENIEAFEELVDLRVPSIANPSSITASPSRLGRTKANIVAEVLGKNADALVAAITRPNVVSRIDEGTAAFGKLIDETLAKVDEIHSVNINNGLKDFRPIPNTSNVLNTNMLQIDIARPGGELFESKEAAETAARMLFKFKPGDAVVKQQGGGFYLQVNKNMDETSTGVRDLLIDTAHTNPETVTNAFIGTLRSADGVLSKSQNEARKTATFAAEEMQRLVRQASDSFSKAVKGFGGKQRYDRVDRILADNRTTHNPVTNNMGVYFNDLGSFEEGWFKMFNTFPNEKDAIAYFTARQLNDFDYLARNIEVYTYKGRQGIQNFEISSLLEGADGKSVTAFTKPFEGKAVDKLPTSGEGHRIWVVDSKGGRVVEPHKLSAKDKKDLYKSLKDENYRYVQVFDPQNSGLAKYVKGLDGNTNLPINFVATKDLRASSLKLTDQVPYREGGHVVYDNQAYIKQAQVKGNIYNGDKTLSAHTIRGEADEFVKDLETARVMLKDSDPKLTQHVTTRLGMSMQEFRRTMAGFDIEQPFKVVDNKGTVLDRTKLKDQGIVDLTSSEYNLASEMRTKFLAEKGDEIMSFEKGSGQNPVWKQEKARMMDPLRVINASMRQIVDSAIYNNYKIKSAEEFIAQYGDLLNVSEKQLRNAPLYHFYNPVWKTVTEGDAVRLAAAKNAQRAMLNLVETPTSVRATWQGAKNNFIQATYKSLGKDAAEWVDESALFRTRDPIRFARSFAFHTSLGMFNPVQFFLQVQNLGSMTAIAGPRIAAAAHKDAFLLNMLRMNDSSEVMNYWAKKFGSPHFAELKRELTNSGFKNVGGTATYLDDVSDAKMFQGTMGSVLDFGTTFYRYGEEINRTSAYSIAYREFREANPTKLIDDADRRRLITRADDLTTNMTRASNASIQNGFGSIPLQFFGYQWRLAEQVWTGAKGTGKLSRPETARLLAWNAMAYGIPVGVAGAVTGVWPWYESLEVYAQNKGIDLDTNLFTSTFSRGVLETGLNHMTGSQWNFSDRYGPGGMPTLKEVLSGEKGMEALLGVSGQAIGKVYSNLSPALFGVSTAFNTDDKKFPLNSHDVLDAMKTISTVNLATKAWMAHNLGVYESKTGVKLLDGQSGDASWPILLGMQPRDILKLYAKKDILRDQAKALKDITGLVQKEVSRALQSETSQEAEKFFARARVYINAAGTLTPQQKNSMLAGALRGFTDEQINGINLKWIKASPDNKTMDDRIKLLGIETQNRKGQ